MFTGVGQLQQIVKMLPAPAQGPVNMAITRVTAILSSIFGPGSPSGATTGGMLSNLPIPTNLPIPCGLPIPNSCRSRSPAESTTTRRTRTP